MKPKRIPELDAACDAAQRMIEEAAAKYGVSKYALSIPIHRESDGSLRVGKVKGPGIP